MLADALTWGKAIAAVTAGKYLGWNWMDRMMGLVGSIVIAKWSIGLLRQTSAVLLDGDVDQERHSAIAEAIEKDSDDRVADLHVWRVGPRHLACIVSVVTETPRSPGHYKGLLEKFGDLAHVTVEVHARTEAGGGG